MYNIKVHYVKVTEPCSVYLPRKIEICRSYMRSNRLYILLIDVATNLPDVFVFVATQQHGYPGPLVSVISVRKMSDSGSGWNSVGLKSCNLWGAPRKHFRPSLICMLCK